MGKDRNRELDVLRVRAEDNLRLGRPESELRPLLERMVRLAAPASEDALFARRHLAELCIEQQPWVAALHLRQVALHVQDDDVVFALMGLCQALLGNFQAAANAYRKASRLAPRNPWYHHNLGHLLDVALGQPQVAERHLRLAHRLEPEEHEITSSLAHCLARVDHLEEAEKLALEAHEADRGNPEHAALLDWIRGGASSGDGPRLRSGVRSNAGSQATTRPKRRRSGGAMALDVEKTLERGMREAGFSAEQLDQARALWADFREGRRLHVSKPESYAAAVEYAIACVQGLDGVTQTSVAKRYGIARRTLAHRYVQIREALELEPGDPRYLAH